MEFVPKFIGIFYDDRRMSNFIEEPITIYVTWLTSYFEGKGDMCMSTNKLCITTSVCIRFETAAYFQMATAKPVFQHELVGCTTVRYLVFEFKPLHYCILCWSAEATRKNLHKNSSRVSTCCDWWRWCYFKHVLIKIATAVRIRG